MIWLERYLNDVIKRREALLKRFVDLCMLGNVDETTEALGWGELIKETKIVLGLKLDEMILDEHMKSLDSETVESINRSIDSMRASSGGHDELP